MTTTKTYDELSEEFWRLSKEIDELHNEFDALPWWRLIKQKKALDKAGAKIERSTYLVEQMEKMVLEDAD
jgi:uncharacterized coiled-coil DUF342 family protein